jgi:hypothetical protein
VLEELLGRPAVAAADDQRALGLRVRDRREVDEVLVIEELVLLAGHEMAVEAEQPAERLGLVHLDRLVGRAEFLVLPLGPDEEAPLVGEVLGHHAGSEVAAGVSHARLRAGSPGSACARA